MNNKRIDLQEFYKGLDDMFKRKNSSETKSYLEKWLKTAEETDDKAGIVAVSNELGGFCRVLGEIERAKELYSNTISLLEQMGLGDTEHYATALINVGDVYLEAKDMKRAQEFFTAARGILVKCGMGNDYRMAALCNNISAIYRQTRQFREAEDALNVAFNIIGNMPEARGELATTYINLGELQIKQNKLNSAKESLLKAVEIFEKDTKGKDVHYSAACASLGQVYYLLEDFISAELFYEKALEMIERDFGKTPSYHLVESNLTEVRSKMK